MVKAVRLKGAAGLVWGQNVTKIRQGEFKGRVFKRGAESNQTKERLY